MDPFGDEKSEWRRDVWIMVFYFGMPAIVVIGGIYVLASS